MSGKKISKIGVMTCGGDCPGLNPVIRAITITAISKYGWEVLGIEDSCQGLIDLNYQSPYGNMSLTLDKVDDIISKGGTIIGSDNHSDPFRFAVKQKDGTKKEEDVSDKFVANFKTLGLDALIMIGGDGTMAIGGKLIQKGIPIVGIPKTIDNDLEATDCTFGFNTAVQTIVDAIDKIRDTARSHDRCIIVEVMGRDAGWLALHSGIASAADVILIPEIPYDVRVILKALRIRRKAGYPFTIIVIAEGAVPKGGVGSFLGERKPGEMIRYGGAAARLQDELIYTNKEDSEDYIPLEIRVTVLGYIQRGGSPSNFDRYLGTRFGTKAVELVAEGKFGYMTSLRTPDIIAVPFSEVMNKQKLVDPHGENIKSALRLGICLGVVAEP